MAEEHFELTTTCNACGTSNPASSRFCHECGSALHSGQESLVCAACRAPNPHKSRFCGACGAPLQANPVARTGESDVPSAPISPTPGGGRPGGLRERLARRGMLDRDETPNTGESPVAVVGDPLSADAPPIDTPEREPRAVRQTASAPDSATASREIALARSFSSPDFRRRPRRTRAVVPQPVAAPAPEAVSRSRERSRLQQLTPRLLHLMVLLAIVVPFVVPSAAPGAGDAPGARLTPSPETRAFSLALDRVPADAPVLVAFDWEAGQIGEMQPMARAVIGRMFERQLRIIAISLTPQGPALAQHILDEEARRVGASYGQHYVNLGYLPGNEPALVAFSADFQQAIPRDYYQSRPLSELSALNGVQRAADVALIVDLAADEATPVRWIQQIGSRIPVPIIAGVSAGAGPSLMPYTRGEPAQLSGLLVGLAGTAEFVELIGSSEPALWNQLTAQSMGQMALFVAIVLGNAVLIANRLRQSRAGGELGRSQKPLALGGENGRGKARAGS